MDCLLIDDFAADTTAAEAAGIRGLVFESNAQTIAGIERHLTRRW
ncbi:hypothetical protein [Streptomyces sp. NBC_01217]|nr:hypothetical protein OG507_06170 [Streptomyces sp. NBC_01217]